MFSFAWESVPTYPDGRAQLRVDVPPVIGTWVVSAFSISQQAGLTVLPNVLIVRVIVQSISLPSDRKLDLYFV